MQPLTTNSQSMTKRAELEAYGLSSNDTQYRVNLKEYTSTQFYAASGTITDGAGFFVLGTAVTAFNTNTFPRNETAVEVLGIKVTHNLQLLSSNDVLVTSKQNQWFEQFSRIVLTYGQVTGRFSLPISALSGINPTIVNSGESVTTQRSNSVYNDGYFRLPKGCGLKIGAKQDAFWNLSTTGISYTLAAADAAGINANSVAPTGAGGIFFLSVGLLVKEYADSNS